MLGLDASAETGGGMREMMDAKEEARDRARMKARALRYKKSLVVDLNWERIRDSIIDMGEAASEVRWDDRDELAEKLGDEDEAAQFIDEFGTLAGDLERFREDLDEWEFDLQAFDDCMVASGAGEFGGGLMGFDQYEGDYFGLGRYEAEAGVDEARKRLMRMTKEKIVEAFHDALRIICQYETLRYRYDCLETAINMLRDSEDIKRATLEEMDRLYDECEAQRWEEYSGPVRRFDRLMEQMPDDAWLK